MYTFGYYKVKAILLHGEDNYQYDKTVVGKVTYKTKISVVCQKHGEFKTVLNSHLSGSKCPSCYGRNTPRTTGYYKVKSILIQSDRNYDYSLFPENLKASDRVDIICPKHGVFNQLLSNHTSGKGCVKCSFSYRKNKTRLTRKEWIAKALLKHNNKYDYSLWDDKILNAHAQVISICPEHGSWVHNINSHVHKGAGCPGCGASQGFTQTEPGFVYLLRSEDAYIKIGISNDYVSRISVLKNRTPFAFYTLAVFWHQNGTEVMKMERELHRKHPTSGLKGFDGATEWRNVLDLGILDTFACRGFTRIL